jgi:hypothetical protein
MRRYVWEQDDCVGGRDVGEWCEQLKDTTVNPFLEEWIPPPRAPELYTLQANGHGIRLPAVGIADKRAKVRAALLDPTLLTALVAISAKEGGGVRSARRMTLLRDNLIKASERILSDWATIQAVFFPGKTLQSLRSIVPTGSDFHMGGEQVLILSFATNTSEIVSLIYKPRDLEFEALISGDLTTLRQRLSMDTYNPFPAGTSPETTVFSAVEILNQVAGKAVLSPFLMLPRNVGSRLAARGGKIDIRQSYGYSQDVRTAPPVNPTTNPEAEDRMVEKMGALAAIAYLLGISDLHYDNVIVAGETPYLIDTEVGWAPTQTLANTQLISNRFGNPSGGSVKLYAPFSDTFEQYAETAMLKYEPAVAQAERVQPQIEKWFCTYAGALLWEHKRFEPLLAAAPAMVVRVVMNGTQAYISHRSMIASQFPDALPTRQQILALLKRKYESTLPQNRPTDRPYTPPLYNVESRKWPEGVSHDAYLDSTALSYAELDIPSFYRRVGVRGLLNSAGEEVAGAAPNGKLVPFIDSPTPGALVERNAMGDKATANEIRDLLSKAITPNQCGR